MNPGTAAAAAAAAAQISLIAGNTSANATNATNATNAGGAASPPVASAVLKDVRSGSTGANLSGAGFADSGAWHGVAANLSSGGKERMHGTCTAHGWEPHAHGHLTWMRRIGAAAIAGSEGCTVA
jgi:hypothetical protein